MRILGVVRHALARVEERQAQLGEVLLRVFVEQPDGLGRVDHRPTADGDEQVRRISFQQGDSAADGGLVRFRLDLAEHLDVFGAQVGAQFVDHSPLFTERVGDDHDAGAGHFPEVLEGPCVEEGVRRYAEPLRRGAAVRDGLDIEQLLVVDVLGGARPAPRAAAQRERGREVVVDPAEGPYRGRGVDEDPAGPHGQAVGVDHGRVGGVDGGSVAETAVFGDEDGGVDAVLDVAGAHEAEDRHQLLLHQGVRREPVQVGRQRREQHLHRRIHRETRPGGEFGSLLAERGEVDLVAAAERELGDRLRLFVREQVRPHPLELRDGGVVDLVVDDAGLFGGADHGGVEGLRDEDVDDGAPDVGCAVQVDGSVAWTHTEGGLAGGVGESDDLLPAGDPDEVDLRMLEQVMGDFVSGVGDDLERAGRHAGGFSRRAQDLHRALARPHGERRRSEDDGIAGLRGDDRLVQHGGGGVGDRGDGQDDADGFGDTDDAVFDILLDDSDGLLVLEVVVEKLGRHVVLDYLVLEDTEPGLLDRHRCEFRGRPDAGPHHGFDDRIDLLLVECAELGRCRGCRVDDRVDLLVPDRAGIDGGGGLRCGCVAGAVDGLGSGSDPGFGHVVSSYWRCPSCLGVAAASVRDSTRGAGG